MTVPWSIGRTVLFMLMLSAGLGMSPIADSAAAEDSPLSTRQLAAIETGRRGFVRCVACHALKASVRPLNGPHLEGIVGRRAGSVAGFNYTTELKDQSFNWTRARLVRWLRKPQADFPGLCLPFTGLPRRADREALVAYMERPLP